MGNISRFLAQWLVVFVLIGCSRSAAIAPPSETLREIAVALRNADAEALHARLQPALREQVTVEAMRASLELSEGEAEGLAGELGEASLTPVMQLETSRGEVVELRSEDGAWRVHGGVFVPVLSSPEDAVRSLRAALQRRSFEAMLDVLARGPRSDLQSELERFIEDTADPLSLHAEIDGNHARVRIGSGRVVHLLREGGEWRVERIAESVATPSRRVAPPQ